MADRPQVALNDGSVTLGYNDAPWTFSYRAEDVYTVDALPIRRPLMSLREELTLAAKQVAHKAQGRPIYVMFSGGADSEVILEAFRLADIAVTAVINEWEDGLNEHDTRAAKRYLDRVKLHQAKCFPINIRNWLASNEAREYAKAAQTIELGYTHLFKTMHENLRDGICITGFEEPLVWRVDHDDGSSTWEYHSHERHYSMYKFFYAFGQDAVPSFYQWSTELLNAYIYNDHWLGLFNNQYNRSVWHAEMLKPGYMYKELGIIPRKKLTGYENVIAEIIEENDEWTSSLPLKWARSRNEEIFSWFKRMGVCQLPR